MQPLDALFVLSYGHWLDCLFDGESAGKLRQVCDGHYLLTTFDGFEREYARADLLDWLQEDCRFDLHVDYAPRQGPEVGLAIVEVDAPAVAQVIPLPEPVAMVAETPREPDPMPEPATPATDLSGASLPDLWHAPFGDFKLERGVQCFNLTWLTPTGKARASKKGKYKPIKLEPWAAQLFVEHHGIAERLQWAVKPLQWIWDKAESKGGRWRGRVPHKMVSKILTELPEQMAGLYTLHRPEGNGMGSGKILVDFRIDLQEVA